MHLKAILLGPDGQLGRDVRRAHARFGNGIELIPLGRESLDVSARGAVESVLRGLDFDVLVNCAAYTAVDEAEGRVARAYSVNADAVRAMARVCSAKRARFIHVSTDYVFGEDSTRNRPLREHDPIAPVNVYGASKAKGEALAGLESDDVVILRVASLFGVAGTGGRGGNFVETMIRAARATEYAAGRRDDQTMSPTAAADVANVMIRMLAEGCESGVYHVVNTGSATWFEFAREIVRRAGDEGAVVPCATVMSSDARNSATLQRARQRQGRGCIRRHADLAGRARTLPARTGEPLVKGIVLSPAAKAPGSTP